MKLCNDTITVLNGRVDDATGFDAYYTTVITGVSWYGTTASAVTADGLKVADKVTVRIPDDADCSGKSYAAPAAYAEGDPASLFTLRQGDVIARGAFTDADLTPARLRELCGDVITILGVTDNRRAPRGRHLKVVGQ